VLFRSRGAILAMHELAQENFRANLHSPAGEAARAYIAKRGLTGQTVEHFGLGYSDRSGRALLRLFEQQHYPAAQMEQSGLVKKRSEEHTSELQSRFELVCRLLLE